MKIIKWIAFTLLVIGTTGLLFNEFVADWGSGVTITFACLNVLGFVALAFAAWIMGKRKAE